MTRERERVYAVIGDEPSRTKQSFAEACNPNVIVEKYKRTGVVNHITPGDGVYGNFDQFESLQGALEKVEAMWKEFGSLSAHVRDEADNDPLIFAQMLESEDGLEDLVQAGLRVVDPETGEIRVPKTPEFDEEVRRIQAGEPPKGDVREGETVTE